MDTEIHSFTSIERAELRTGDLPDAAVIESKGWIGGDYHRFWWKADLEQLLKSPKSGDFELQALYGRLVSPFWDVLAGVRLDRSYSGRERDTTGYLVVGLEGLSPYRFELEPSLAVSERGDVAFTLGASYDLLITQRLILEPRVDLRLTSEREEMAGTFLGEGVNDLDLGLRLRYDIRRTFAPYLGIEWHRPLGASSGLARRADQGGWRSAFVLGIRAWY